MKKILFYSVLTFLSSAAYAGNLSVKIENQVIIAKACNLKQGTKNVWFFVGQKGYAKNGIGKTQEKFENNCAIKTYNNSSNDLFLKGGEVFAAYDMNGKEPIQLSPETVSIPNAGTPSTPSVPPEDKTLKISYKSDSGKVQVLICASPEYMTLGKNVAINNITKQKSTGQYTGSSSLSKKMIGDQRCAEHIYDAKDISNGDTLTIVVGSENKEVKVSGLSQSNPPVVVNPPEDPRKEIESAKVKNYATQAANFFANRVVDIYGKVENYKYNFYLGFRKAAALYTNLGLSVQNLPQYSSGKQLGLTQGYQQGFNSGKAKGESDGIYFGQKAAAARFRSAVGNSNSLDVTPGDAPNGNDFEGLTPSLSNPDIRTSISNYNNDFYNELRSGYSFDTEVDFDSDLNGRLYGASIDISDFYNWNNYKNEVLLSYWKSENAFSLFLSKRLIKSSSVDYNKVKANNELVAKYKEITDPTLYKDAEQNKQIYKSAFVNQYDNVIDDKWNNEVYGKTNNSAQIRGEFYFTQAIQSYAQTVGYNEGYVQKYTKASKDGYSKVVGTAYLNKFDQTVNYYTNNAVFEDLQMELVNQEGKKFFAIIDSVIPVVKNIVNLGKVSGKLTVSISSTSGVLNSAANTTLEMEVPSLSQLKNSQPFGTISQISSQAIADGNYQVTMATSAGNQTLPIEVSWFQTIRQVTKDSAQRQQILVKYLSNTLGKEMTDMKSVFKKNKYKSEPQNTFAGKFVTSFTALPPQEKQILNQFQASIVAGMGKRPTNLICIGCGKDEWDSAQSLFKQIGWSLTK
ncbi:MAG: hypothetical protein L6Q37_08000 [Bdellovibrionaceae bacterium]|nr:hypothetical protein [Pseudobdellovibrionaceae bacterium]NUM59900.1 hypothetical protein [Pseudobdellovibrionaceae bacterium]